jgi:hypothetical protein
MAIMIKRFICVAVLFISLSATALADGGRLRFSKPSGPFLVTLFTTPEPLTPGPSDFSVMIQDAKTGDILSDAAVTLHLTSAHGAIINAVATHGIATNRLLQAAQFNLPSSGNWHLHLDIQQGAKTSSVDADIPVQQGSRKAVLVWTFTALPLLAMLLFILHQRQKAFLGKRSFKAT